MNRSKGLGDSIEKVTQATGLKSLTEIAARAAGFKDCGCNKRKAWLNRVVPYKQVKRN